MLVCVISVSVINGLFRSSVEGVVAIFDEIITVSNGGQTVKFVVSIDNFGRSVGIAVKIFTYHVVVRIVGVFYRVAAV